MRIKTGKVESKIYLVCTVVYHTVFICRNLPTITQLENLLKEADSVGGCLPTKAVIKETVKKARDWIVKSDSLMVCNITRRYV